MKKGISVIGACALATVFAALPPAYGAAITINSATNLTITYNGFASGTPLIPGLSAEVTLSNFLFSNATVGNNPATQVTFNYQIFNSSSDPITSARVSNFAFNTTPNVLLTNINAVTGVFDTIQVNKTQPNGIGQVEICFTESNCPGGGNGGVAQGQTGAGSATLYFAGAGRTSFVIDSSFVRYQGIDCADDCNSCPSSASGVPTGYSNAVPEPSTNALISAGLIGIWFAGRRMRKRY